MRPRRLHRPYSTVTPHRSSRPIDPARVYRDFLPDLVERNKGFAWARCPFHDDHNPSFCINLNTGWYRCFSSCCGATGSNIAGFAGALLGLSYKDARSYLERHYG